ncbi:hypothetical protein [Sphingomonas sp. PB4P5]|uniref:hypothetical protein n=1 Tax=Parasphingomonas puruogangriensis TaxID=3096155 RepID=UPI002FC99445
MTLPGRQWQAMDLQLAEVHRHPSFQMRAKGVDRAHANRLLKVLLGGGDLPAIRVARVGKALYVVDGFHRMEAHEAAGRVAIKGLVAKMSLKEAQEEARLANTTHGKGLTAADKAKAFDAMIAAGGHLDAHGALKSSRTIEAEMNHGGYSYETIRKRLKALGLELEEATEFPKGFKPWRGGAVEEDEEQLAEELTAAACGHLRAFHNLYFDLPDDDQRDLLGAARELVGALERGERAERAVEVELDI